jgi:hypothetical protein
MEAGLERLRSRIPEDDYQSCLLEIEVCRNPARIPFHWEDKGSFLKETEIQSESDEFVEFNAMEGGGKSILVDRAVKNVATWKASVSQKSRARVGEIVAYTQYTVKGKSKDGACVAGGRNPEFYIGKVIKAKPDGIECRYFDTCARDRLGGKWRAHPGKNGLVIVPPDALLVSFANFRTTKLGKKTQEELVKVLRARRVGQRGLVEVDNHGASDIDTSEDEEDTVNRYKGDARMRGKGWGGGRNKKKK